jgi:hypothetical protein
LNAAIAVKMQPLLRRSLRELAMAVPSKIEQLREIRGLLPQATWALTAMISLVAMLAFGSVLPKPALWHLTAGPSALPAAEQQAWAGHLANPGTAQQPATEPLTSASYTSGFDKAAAGLAPPPVSPAKPHEARDPRACPDDLNCSFRTGKVAPPRRSPAGVTPVAAASAPPDVAAPTAPPPAPHPSGLAALRLPSLPSPHTLLKPFTFVADTFTGFIKKL